MKAKLIKLALHDGYRLDDENGLYIASTLESLSFKNCQAIERGYDLDELAKTIFPDKIFTTDEEHEIPIDGFPYQWGFKVGFQKALELMGNKKFSEEDILDAWEDGATQKHPLTRSKKENLLKSLQQTEWDVEIEMEGFVDEEGIYCGERPKLDADGCLILKSI